MLDPPQNNLLTASIWRWTAVAAQRQMMLAGADGGSARLLGSFRQLQANAAEAIPAEPSLPISPPAASTSPQFDNPAAIGMPPNVSGRTTVPQTANGPPAGS